jgi:hypothetical protein
MHFGERKTLITTYRLSEPSPLTRAFWADGELVQGQQRAEFVDINSGIVDWGLTGAAVAREWSNGLQVGVELLYERRHIGRSTPTDVLIGDQASQSDFAVYEESRHTDFSAALSAGYTLRRDKRLQVYVGAILLSRFSRSGYYEDWLLRFADARSFSVDRRPIFVREAGYDLRVLPQLGLRYRLSSTLRLSLLTGPGLSVQTSYLFGANPRK